MPRKEKNIHYIYKTICNVTGRYYVGMHSTSKLDDGYMGSGLRLRRSIRKYGIENHTKEILEYLPTREALVHREIEIVTKELISEDLCMNLREGGTGGWVNEIVQLKCSKAGGRATSDRMNNDEDFKLIVLDKLRNNRINAYKAGKFKNNKGFINKNHSDETKSLMSEQRKGTGTGEMNSQFGTCWITKDDLNKKIKKEDLEVYLNEAWTQGRKKKL